MRAVTQIFQLFLEIACPTPGHDKGWLLAPHSNGKSLNLLYLVPCLHLTGFLELVLENLHWQSGDEQQGCVTTSIINIKKDGAKCPKHQLAHSDTLMHFLITRGLTNVKVISFPKLLLSSNIHNHQSHGNAIQKPFLCSYVSA
ncbi:LOW QUALITY PROTEIN: hypothetical protein NC652_017296 [Populus alba x Populus x berolinensis]|nr:LOW QUALITY PROTEIN: hypothetical protein NC652_017296 [Populus alba x Populus x berolinensis]